MRRDYGNYGISRGATVRCANTKQIALPINKTLNRYFVGALFAVICVLAAHSASAALTSLSWQPTPVDLNDLDHHNLYTWRIDNITVNPSAITSATITFNNIANW